MSGAAARRIAYSEAERFTMPGSFSDDSDHLQFIEEDDADAPVGSEQHVWRVLIVDDDADVHETTELALQRIAILGRPIQFLHAYSAAQARQILSSEPDIAVILLDVVMEQQDAGLQLVHYVRFDAGLKETRIVLRTGQPGYAPEIDAIRDYDINDYKTKAELTRPKLYSTLTVAIRSYSQLRALNSHRQGLDAIIRASNELLAAQGLPSFATGVLTLLCRLLKLSADGLVCARSPGDVSGDAANHIVIAALGRFAGALGRPLSELGDAASTIALARCLGEQRNQFTPQGIALYFGGRAGRQVAAYMDAPAALDEIDRQLLEVFGANLAARLDNIELFSQLHDYAYFDPLLRLPNRIAFIAALDAALAEQPRTDQVAAILSIDHFGDINIALGHRFGDQLLAAVGARLSGAFGPQAMVARVSGDTFGVLASGAQLHPEAIAELFSTPIRVADNEVSVTVSTGLVRFAEVDGSGNEAYMEASIAAKQAKSDSRSSCVYYSRAMETQTRQRVTLHQKLRAAFDQKRLTLHYQPQLSLETGKVIGCEALLRWREEGQYIPPNQFVPLAESSGLIIPIGLWVLRTACQEQVRLQQAGHADFRMAVNVSMAQLRHSKFLESLDQVVAESGIAPAQLELEITESMAMLDPSALVGLLHEIDARGITVAIDDFGTGFSSLSYLQQYRVHRLKIDQSFVHSLQDAKAGENSIAELVVQLGRKLNLSVIAEGVEYPEQAELLRRMGCHEAQGYHFARPMDADSLLNWLAGAGKS